MHVNQILLLLLSSLPAKNKFTLSWVAINFWQKEAFNTLLENDLIKPVSNATNIQCQACENNCSIDVHPHEYPHKTLYYAVCEDPVMHDQMGRMRVPFEELKQWQCSIKQLALVVAKLLSLDINNDFQNTLNKTRLGMLKTPTGRKWVSLLHDPLSLEVNQEILPLNEILFFEENNLCLDMDRINAVLLNAQLPATKPYAVNHDKQTIRKANTQAMYQDWQDEFDELQRNNPTQSKSWLCNKLALLPIAKGKSAETIRKNVKK